ncbi:hypothetical protein ABZY68_31060 [Streptomyces sp. NPDC006482]|uniref:hypothetical protein n=1 Tax=Streptomyces sp. NPDC006482 TaxID=3154306 RepID=UPI0033B950D1
MTVGVRAGAGARTRDGVRAGAEVRAGAGIRAGVRVVVRARREGGRDGHGIS